MGKHTFTPGPWVADGLTILAPNGYRVCRLTEPHKSERGRERIEGNEYRAGNAALVSAATELFALAEDYLQQCWDDWHSHMSQEQFDADSTVIKIRAAISKATGGDT